MLFIIMARYEPKLKETIEDRLQRAINLGREEALKEVLEWLDESVEIITDSEGTSFICLNYFCDTKGEVLQLFKERFNIE